MAVATGENGPGQVAAVMLDNGSVGRMTSGEPTSNQLAAATLEPSSRRG